MKHSANNEDKQEDERLKLTKIPQLDGSQDKNEIEII